MKLILMTTLLLIETPQLFGANISHIKRLQQDKMNGYDPYLRPATNQSQRIDIYIQYNIGGILELVELSEKLSFSGYLSMTWTDEFMKWNKSDFDNIEWLMIPADKVWHPTFAIVNPYEKIETVHNNWDMIRYFYNGTALYTSGGVMNVKCPMETTFYPWDIQKCFVFYSTIGYLPHEVMLISSRDDVTRRYFLENGQWELTGSKAFSGLTEDFSMFVLEFTMERKPTFLIVNIILPIIFMSVLNILVFFLPVESGERVSYAITVLLSIAVFLTLVGDNLPKNSNPMPILSFYLLGVLCLSVLICFFTIFNLHIYFKDDLIPVPRCLQLITACCLCCKMRIINRGKPYRIQRPLSRNDSQSDVHRYRRDNDYRCHPENDNRYQNNTETDKIGSNVTWQDVSIAGDKICFVISFLTLLIVTIIFMVLLTQRKEEMAKEHVYMYDEGFEWL